MVPSIYGENMFDEFFDNNGFFGSHSPLFGKNSKNPVSYTHLTLPTRSAV